MKLRQLPAMWLGLHEIPRRNSIDWPVSIHYVISFCVLGLNCWPTSDGWVLCDKSACIKFLQLVNSVQHFQLNNSCESVEQRKAMQNLSDLCCIQLVAIIVLLLSCTDLEVCGYSTRKQPTSAERIKPDIQGEETVDRPVNISGVKLC